jgi:hypothetical protein
MASVVPYNGTVGKADSGQTSTGVSNLNIFYDVRSHPFDTQTTIYRINY